jgi:hypothetical protein
MAPWETRKRAELSAKLHSVTDEHEHWLAVSERRQPMEKHHSQIRAITGYLQPMAERLDRQVTGNEDMRTGWRKLEREVLDLHHVWSFFRDKWALRRLEEYGPYLVLADEFAWACYEPAQVQAVEAETVRLEAVRQPPLIYLGPVDGPLALARGDSIEDRFREEPLRSRTAQALVRQLPLPVVAVPWYQLRHLPEALIIGHEVGHVVLVDFLGLEAVEQLVVGRLAALCRPEAERDRWQAWTEEAFADVYGVLCGGPAYLETLGDFLLPSAEPDAGESWYPPPLLRLGLTTAALEAAGCREAAKRVRASWEDEGVCLGDADGHDTAVEVGRALVAGPYPAFGREATTLDQVITCTAQCATGDQARLLVAKEAWKPGTREIRTLLAVAAEAFRLDPAAFARPVVQANILEKAAQIQQPGIRYLALGSRGGKEPTADPARVDQLYRTLTGGDR